MGLAFVNGATNSATSSTSTLTVTYSPTSGNIVFVFVGSQTASLPTVADSASNSLTAFAVNPVSVSTTFLYGFSYVVPSAGITSFVTSFGNTGLEVSMAVLEYSVSAGTMTVIAASTPSNVGNGTASDATITSTLQFANDFLVVGFQTRNVTETAWSAGNIRKDVGTATARVSAGDNTSASASAVTCTVSTATVADWAAIAGELKFIPFAPDDGYWASPNPLPTDNPVTVWV